MPKIMFILVSFLVMGMTHQDMITSSYLPTKSTLVNELQSPPEYHFKFNNTEYHSGLMLFYIIFISMSFIYLISKLFCREKTKDFIRRKNMKIIFSCYQFNFGTSINLDEVFDNVDLVENNICRIQNKKSIRKSDGVFHQNNENSHYFYNCIAITFKIDNTFVKVKLFKNGTCHIITRKIKMFKKIMEILVKILTIDQSEKYISSEINICNFHRTCIYNLRLEHQPNFENIGGLFENFIESWDVYPMFTRITFCFEDIIKANVKIHNNGNAYIVITSPSNNQKNCISKIHDFVIKNF
ncbi:putative orfan [Tupanvirus soda lake]|uniref:Orfan n=2 Tax=Tupanvirus TaxID=2094720 RepID=A0AC62ACC5_9VIRU|nr:putative orfan [Tupanvirus soda lake]QKU35399.1 putative orfan [Tupanvirus soda lake]